MTIPKQNTPEWQAWRRGGLGASDLAVIVGADPWRSEHQLALEKRGLTDDVVETWPMQWGHLVQRIGIEAYHLITDRVVRNVNTTVLSKEWPHCYASLDGKVTREKRGVEVKWSSKRYTEPPRHWLVQVYGQMGVANLDAVDIVKLSGYEEPLIWTIERDDALVRQLLDMAEAWYVRYVVGDDMPPIDGSRATSKYLDSFRGPDVVYATDEQVTDAEKLRAVRATLAQAQDDEAVLVNRLKASMAGAEALEAPAFHISWKPQQERATVDWRATAADLAVELANVTKQASGTVLTEAATAHTTVKEGPRPFRLTWKEQE